MSDLGKTKAQILEQMEALHSRMVQIHLEPYTEVSSLLSKSRSEKHYTDESAQLDHLYQFAPVGLCFIDTDLRFVRINEHLASFHGRTVTEHLGRTVREVIPDLAPTLEPIYRKVIETGLPATDVDIRVKTPADTDQERGWVASYYPVKSPEGHILGVNTVVHEIYEHKRTERALKNSRDKERQRTAELEATNAALRKEIADLKDTEQTLRDAEAKTRVLLEGSPVCNKIIDLDSRLIYMSTAGQEMLKIADVEPCYGETFPPEFFPEASQNAISKHLERAKAGEASDLEVLGCDVNGKKLWLHMTFVPARDESGQVEYVITTSINITGRKRAEQALRDSELRNRTLLEGSPICNKIIDLDSRLLYMSSAGQKMLKVADIKPFYGSTFPPDFYPEETQVALKENMERAKAGEITSLECLGRDVKGGDVWFHTTFVPARADDGQVQYLIATSVDITERKRAEKQLHLVHEQLEQRVQERTAELVSAHGSLRDSEERFRSMFENAAAGMVLNEADGKFVQVNDAFCRWLGYTKEELLKLSVPDVTHPDDLAESRRRLAEVEEGVSNLIDIDKRYVRKNGETVWGHVTSTRLPVEQIAPNRPISVAMVQDITERKWVQIALQTVVEGTSDAFGSEFFSSLVRNLAAALHVTVAFVAVRHPTIRKQCSLLAMWDGNGCAEPFEYQVSGTPCERILTEGIASYPSGVQELFPDDHWLQEKGLESYLAVRINDRHGSPLGHLGVMHHLPMLHDLPIESILRVFAARAGAELERKQSEDALRGSERRSREQLSELEVLYRTSPLGLCHLDTKLRFLRCNETLAKINGIPAADHIGRTLQEIIPEITDTIECNFRKVIETGQPLLDVLVTGKTAADPDTTRHFSASYYPVKSEDGVVQGVSSIVQDITVRKQIEEEQRQQLQDELTHLSRVSTLGEMAAMLAHELNQPLAAIGNYADGSLGMLQSDDADPNTVRDSLGQIGQLTRRAGKIIQRIRGLVRKDERNRSVNAPNDLVREVVELVEFEARAKAVNIKLDLADDLPPVTVDRIQIQQVIVNIVRNAFDAMADNDQRPAKVTIQTRLTPDHTIEFSASDTGKGFPNGTGEKIFEPFFTTKSNGLGLGLGISQAILEAHGGRLRAEARTDGATFRFFLPTNENGRDQS